jgi:methylene-tetrahydromethanopterin dehydrogenase
MLHRAKAAMVPPFEVSVFADPSGAITTAAALVACAEAWLKRKTGKTLEGKNVHIFGGTGPVGICAGILAAGCGANVFLGSHRGKLISQEVADEYNKRFDVHMQGEDYGSAKSILRALEISDVVMGTAKAGIQILSRAHLKHAKRMVVAADVNAVPPLGIEGIDVNDMGKVLEFTPNKAAGIGALAIGNIKYKVHHRLFEMMKTAKRPLYLEHVQAFAVARKFAARYASK